MPQDFSQKNLAQILEARAQESPDKTAFIFLLDGEDREASISYGELDRRARALAAHLREITQPGDRVLLVFAPGLDFIVGVFACLCAGVVAVPLFPPQPGRLKSTLTQFENTVRDAQSQLILCDNRVYSKRQMISLVSKGLRGHQWINVSKFNSPIPDGFQISHGPITDIAFILYTSGSTGDPTGVVLTHQNAIENFRMFSQKAELVKFDPARERGMAWIPPYHVAGLFFGILLPVYQSCTTILMSPLDFLAKPIRWLRAISKYRVGFTGSPNFGYDYCIDRIAPEERKGLDLSRWQFALNGSEMVRPSTLQRFTETYGPFGFRPDTFHAVYGLTETGNALSFTADAQPSCINFSRDELLRHKVHEASSAEINSQTLVPNGSVLNIFEIKIVDPETCLPCPPDKVGEIWVKGSGVAAGYWNKKSQTQRAFGAHLAGSNEGPYFRTGDLGFVYRNELFISGRLKEMIIIRGKNYFPQDIEAAIAASIPTLEPENIAVFSAEVEGEEQLIVVAENDGRKDNDEQNLLGEIRESISKNFGLQPHAVLLTKTGSLPRTATLKTKRGACRDLFLIGKLPIRAQWFSSREGLLSPPAEHRELISLPQNEQELDAFAVKKIAAVLDLTLDQLDLNQSLPSYGLDSLRAVELSHFFETHLKIRLGIGLLFESQNIRSILDEIKIQWKKVQSEGPQISLKIDLLGESALPEEISFTQPPADTANLPSFLTGATGFLGAFLLDQLLKETRTDIFCLVRAKNREEGLKRIRENLEQVSLWNPAYGDRVRPMLGDLAKPRLGLSETEFNELAGKIGSIYHCGANVNFIFSYWDLKPANVTGTLEMIRLAAAKTTKPLHYISTVGIFPVWGDEHGKSFKEGDPPSPWGGHFSGYAQSKWVAERLIFQALQRGLPATIYRVGEVIGHSETGVCKPEKDAYSNMLKGALMLGEVPHLNLNIYFAPVDMVARGVVHLAKQNSSRGKTFHLFLNAIQGAGLIELLNSQQKKLESKSYGEFLQDMEELNHDLPHNPLAPFTPLLRSAVVMELSKKKSLLKLDSKHTLKELKKAAIPCPPVQQAVQTYLNFLEKTGFLD